MTATPTSTQTKGTGCTTPAAPTLLGSNRSHGDAPFRVCVGDASRAAKKQRQSGPAYELKIFHNRIKRLLLKRFEGRVESSQVAPATGAHNSIPPARRFAFRCERLLDLCCGRGGLPTQLPEQPRTLPLPHLKTHTQPSTVTGDINKWIDSGVKYVLGIDLSPEEIKVGQRRPHSAFASEQPARERQAAEAHPSTLLMRSCPRSVGSREPFRAARTRPKEGCGSTRTRTAQRAPRRRAK